MLMLQQICVTKPRRSIKTMRLLIVTSDVDLTMRSELNYSTDQRITKYYSKGFVSSGEGGIRAGDCCRRPS